MLTSIERPVFIIGAARSGTTMLADMLGRLPHTAVWVEPKYVWRYGNARAQSDVRLGEEAVPKVVRYIRRRVAAYTRKQGADHYVDKTPSNCFRLPFIEQVFPDAVYIHLIRDGRAVVQSAAREWSRRKDRGVFVRRVINGDIPIRELVTYIPEIVRELLFRQMLASPAHTWGPRFPGIDEFRSTHSLLSTCAMQWRQSVEHALRGLDSVPSERQITVTYEDFCREPARELQRICRRVGLPDPGQDMVWSTRPSPAWAKPPCVDQARWNQEVGRIIEPLQARLGYAQEPEETATGPGQRTS